MEVDEKSAGAVVGDNDGARETISFPMSIKQTMGEREEIEATVLNQGLFNYGERPMLFVVIHLLSLKFQSSRKQPASLLTDIGDHTPTGPEDLQIDSNGLQSTQPKLRSHKKLVTICQLELNLESQKKNSKPEI